MLELMIGRDCVSSSGSPSVTQLQLIVLLSGTFQGLLQTQWAEVALNQHICRLMVSCQTLCSGTLCKQRASAMLCISLRARAILAYNVMHNLTLLPACAPVTDQALKP